VKLGDLVKSVKHDDLMGIVVEIFGDLDKDNPWIRVLFTHPMRTHQWVKRNALQVVDQKEEGANK
jgi:hypothetical protein